MMQRKAEHRMSHGGRARRAPYARPRLERLGDLRGRTFGPSIGLGESSNPQVFRSTFMSGDEYEELP